MVHSNLCETAATLTIRYTERTHTRTRTRMHTRTRTPARFRHLMSYVCVVAEIGQRADEQYGRKWEQISKQHIGRLSTETAPSFISVPALSLSLSVSLLLFLARVVCREYPLPPVFV